MLNQAYHNGQYLDHSFLTFPFVICYLIISTSILQIMEMTRPHTPMTLKMKKLLEKNIDKLFNWFSDNFLKANASKRHLLINTDENITLKIKNEFITNSSNKKLLGILFNSKFDFDEHVALLCRKPC